MRPSKIIRFFFVAAFLISATHAMADINKTTPDSERMLTSLSLLIGFPSTDGKEVSNVFIQMGGIMTLDSDFTQQEPDLSEYLKKHPIQLLDLSADLKKTLRLEQISIEKQGTEVLEIAKTRKLDYFDPDSGLELWVTLVSFTADQAIYHVKCDDSANILVDTDISVLMGKRAIVGGMDGDSLPYFFLVLEPLNHLLKGQPIDSVYQNPTLIHQVNPVYPKSCRKAHISGAVLIEARIPKNGKPDEIKVLESPHPELSAAAIAALKQWVFQPATLNGEPVDVKSSFTIHFRLDEKTKDPVVK